MFSGICGSSSLFSSILSITDTEDVILSLEMIVKLRLQTINKVATTAVAFVKKSPADLENMKFSWETPIPNAPPSDYWIKTRVTNTTAKMILRTSKIFSMIVK